MEVRAKKALGQHFLTDQNIAKSIVAALQLPAAGGKAVASEGKVNAEVASVPSVQLTTEQPARMKVLDSLNRNLSKTPMYSSMSNGFLFTEIKYPDVYIW